MKEEITFKIFSEKIKNAFTNPDFFDVDYLNKLYIMFKDSIGGYAFTLDEWIAFIFIDWNLDTHDTMLKKEERKETLTRDTQG